MVWHQVSNESEEIGKQKRGPREASPRCVIEREAREEESSVIGRRNLSDPHVCRIKWNGERGEDCCSRELDVVSRFNS